MMTSWLEDANEADCPFPLQNLPYGIAAAKNAAAWCAAAIGGHALNLTLLESEGLIRAGGAPVFSEAALNSFMAAGPSVWDSVRTQLTDLLADGGRDARLRDDARLREAALAPLDSITPLLPFRVAEYTDFYAGRQHAFNVGTMFRGPENALPPNWLHIPIGYNGRASTVVVSGAEIRRPWGQLKPKDADTPLYAPCKRLDLELEMGAVVGTPNEMGAQVSVAEADEMIFGYVLLNDWSARDIQAWEYQPLGPFQAKAFATTVSPWVVTKAALEPFRVSGPEREKPLLPYLHEPGPMLYDIELEVLLRSAEAETAGVISRTNYRHMYYSSAQQLAHHANGGCKMQTGDLLGSGTVSGPEPSSYGSMLELSWGGEKPLALGNGETRTFLEDGDEVTLRGRAQGENFRIGFGECAGVIAPANPARSWR